MPPDQVDSPAGEAYGASPVSRLWEYFIQYEVFERSGLDDGSGWFETLTDWVTVEAPSWSEARRLGRAKVEVEFPKGGVYENRRDGLHPYHGEHVRRLLVSDA
jgi:hypothetical protein